MTSISKGIYIASDEYVSFAEAHRRLDAGSRGRLTEHIATRDRSPDFFALGMYLPNPDPILKKNGQGY